ncbi:GNAT family N-acetyltransferase [Phycicoccus endophyticus]|uniref:GNAT family N-acetyltransferase n=1 Tax=Phycicoccus endophyticus TaxID=1690220 RepID=A0A7G9R011_9MICO|nr:GNAT family N-acetyltransferase [Phycicoccus endophyticus]NHI20798.1 GNAT family N-acetyltransferase [Phycicoccus endophyticus]QNN48936.1 GNAT family N-acetyltransferase [Phycicoccus endophyticus]GGL44074.1 N-acetyltransferase [Phycicoccus endophyticus]
MGASVRRAGADDIEAVVAFGTAVVPPHYTPILGPRAALAQLDWWTREYLEPAVQAGRVHVATVGDELAGVCQTGETSSGQVIWKLYLAPSHRGHSLGVDLLRHAIAVLPAVVDHVDVEHFRGNTGAGRFYEREGFTVIRTEPAPVGSSPAGDVIWRRLPLTRPGH